MDKELELIVQKMMDAGESEESIASVIREYKVPEEPKGVQTEQSGGSSSASGRNGSSSSEFEKESAEPIINSNSGIRKPVWEQLQERGTGTMIEPEVFNADPKGILSSLPEKKLIQLKNKANNELVDQYKRLGSTSYNISDSQITQRALENYLNEKARDRDKELYENMDGWSNAWKQLKASSVRTVADNLKVPTWVNQHIFTIFGDDSDKTYANTLDTKSRENYTNIKTLINSAKTIQHSPMLGITQAVSAFMGLATQDKQREYMSLANKLQQDVVQFETNINEDLFNGDFGMMATRALTEGVASIPSMTQMMIPYIGMPSLFASASASKNYELQEEGYDLNATTLLNSDINGGAEVIFEMFTKKLAGKMFKSLKGATPEARKTFMGSLYENFVKNPVKEGLSESATEYVQTLSDALVQGDEEAWNGVWGRMADAYLVGKGVAISMGTTTQVSDQVHNIHDDIKVNQIIKSENNNYKTITDAFQLKTDKSKYNVDQLKLANVRNSINILAKDLDGKVKAGEITKDQSLAIEHEFAKTQFHLKKTQGLKLNDDQRVEATNLVKRKENLIEQYKVTDPVLGEPIKLKIEAIDEKLRNIKSFKNEIKETTSTENVKDSSGNEKGVEDVKEQTPVQETKETVKETASDPIVDEAVKEEKNKVDEPNKEITEESEAIDSTTDTKGTKQEGADTSTDGDVQETSIIYEHPVTQQKAKNKEELSKLIIKETEKVKDLVEQRKNKINWDKSKEKRLKNSEYILNEMKKIQEIKPESTIKEKSKQIADNVRKLKINSSVKEAMPKLNSRPTAPFEIAWDGAVETVAKTIEAGGKVAQAIQDGIKHLQSTEWYKELSKEGKVKAEESFTNNFKELNDSEPKTNLDKKTQGIVSSKKPSEFKIRKLLSGVPVLSYLDNVWYKNVTSKVDKASSAFVKKALDSNNKTVRIIGQVATNWFNGLPRTVEELAESRKLTGRQEEAFIVGEKLTKNLQQLINFDPDAATNVHKVLDPEIYNEENSVPLTYESLNTEEKLLHDELKKINAKTHQLNYDNGFIDEKTYNKFKDKYIARAYESFEQLDNIDERGEFINTKIFGKIYKERQAITQWHIDNKVTDPIYLTVNRAIRTQRNIAVKLYADYLSPTAKDSPKEGYVEMKGKQYGSLDGKYVPIHIAEDFKGYSFSNEYMDAVYDAVKGYDRLKARQFLKKFHTVYSPIVQIGNFMSNHAFAFVSGINFVELWGNLPEARKSIKNKDADYQLLVANGIIGSNILTPDLVSLTHSAQSKLKLKKSEKSIGKFIKDADNYAQKLYASSDDIMKLAAYKSIRKAGYNKTEAIERVFDGFQNYATVGKVWDFAAKTPIVGNAYIKFQADLMRIMKNAVVKRPLSTASFLSAIKLMTVIASIMSGEDDKELTLEETIDTFLKSGDEKATRENRAFIPKINVGFTKIPLVMKVGDKEVNLARYMSPFYEYDIPNKSWIESASRFAPFQFQTTDKKEMGQTGIAPEAPDVLLGGLTQAFLQNRDFRNKSISDPYATRYKESGLTTSDKIANKLNYVARSVVPLYSTVQDTYLSEQYGEDFYGRSKTKGDLFLSKFIKVQTYGRPELEKSLIGEVKNIDYEDKIISNKIKSLEAKLTRDSRVLSERVEEGKLSPERASRKLENITSQYEKRYNKYLTELVKIQEKMNTLVDKVDKMRVEIK